MFKPASLSAFVEYEERKNMLDRQLRFGVDYLDDSLRGILPDDLILLGASSGAGKTQLCCNIAYANLEDGKTVHYIALEASRFEIERRLKYPMVFERFISDQHRPRLSRQLNYPDWLLGKFKDQLDQYEKAAAESFEKMFTGLNLYYKQNKFGVAELIESVVVGAAKSDLIIIDHVHYFDFEDDNENRAIKNIAKTVRRLSLEEQKPIVLVAHLRKRDKFSDVLCADMEEFHGSSDLFKIATKVITVGSGRLTDSGSYETFFSTPKNRIDGGVSRFMGRELFSPRKGGYESGKYQVGWSGQTKKEGFQALDSSLVPEWGRRENRSSEKLSSRDPVPSRQSRFDD